MRTVPQRQYLEIPVYSNHTSHLPIGVLETISETLRLPQRDLGLERVGGEHTGETDLQRFVSALVYITYRTSPRNNVWLPTACPAFPAAGCFMFAPVT